MLLYQPALGDLGFDYHYIMAATADRVPCVFIENGKVANYDPSDPIEVSYTKNFPGEPTGKDNPELLYNLHPSNGHDMSIVNGISRIGFMKGGGKALWKDENIADSITPFMPSTLSNSIKTSLSLCILRPMMYTFPVFLMTASVERILWDYAETQSPNSTGR